MINQYLILPIFQARQIQSFAFISVLFFTLASTFAFHPDKQIILPTFLLLLLQLTLILAFSHTFDALKENGILAIYLSIGDGALARVVYQKILLELTAIIPAYSLFAAALLYVWADISWQESLFWLVLFVVNTLTTMGLTYLAAALKLSHQQGSFMSLFLIFPFLFPSLLLSLLAFESFQNGQTYLDYFYLNFSLSLVTLGLSFALTPKLIAQAYHS